MSQHFTPKFQAAYKMVMQVLQEKGENEARIAFRDLMLELGHWERILNLYRIADKQTQKFKFFIPNAAQRDVLEILKKNKDTLILKSRQLGITTLSCIRWLDLALWEEGAKTGILAHGNQYVKEILNEKVRAPYHSFKKDWGHLYAPVEKFDSVNALVFATDGLGRTLNSSIRVMTSFRSTTVQYLHSSETAFTDEKNLLASLKSVPTGGQIVCETTPNGRGGYFYNQWVNWLKTPTRGGTQGIFLPWFRYYPEDLEMFETTETEWSRYEQDLLTSYAEIKPEHVAWRRYAILRHCDQDEDNFEAEYPSHQTKCFFSGHGQVYPATLLQSLESKTRVPHFVGNVYMEANKVTFNEDDQLGLLSIWAKPETGRLYVMGADPGGGIGKDFSVAYVMDRQSREIVACLRGQIEPIEFGRQLYMLGKYYHSAHMCVELNNHGLAVIEKLKSLGYFKFYRHKYYDELTNKVTNRVGFLTTAPDKMRITDALKDALRRREIIITDAKLLDEMSEFIQIANKSGRGVRREAIVGQHDDRVMACAFMLEAHKTLPSPELYEIYEPIQKFDPITGFEVE